MLKFLVFLFTISALFGYEDIPDDTHLPLLAPDWKERQVAKIRLENGLEAYLVSDPKTEESGAALAVKVGSWQEPENSPGLAHFLEHMLFLGTKKYPVESEFETYLSSFRGQSNAFTYNDITAYMFSVRNEGFMEALDRFASFFKDPLFNPSGVKREVKAIDQEWKIHSQDDSFLRQQILKELSSPNHPFARFNAGNEASLKNASQLELRKWYENTYSADKMRLWIMSPLPLEELKALVERDFGGIPRKTTLQTSLAGSVFDPKNLGKMVYMEPIQDETKLSILWELPSSMAEWNDEKPWSLVCWIIGDEGEGSVLAQLKRENLATSLSCGELRLSENKLLFLIEVNLTDLGLKEKDLVIQRIFQGIKRVHEKGISQDLFNEIQALQKLKYQWEPRQSVFKEATDNAFALAYEPLSSYPEKSEVVTAYSPEKIKTFLDLLMPDKAIYFLMAPQKKIGEKYPLKEKWSDTAYHIVPYTYPDFNSLKLDQRIDLPISNRFIPQHLRLKKNLSANSWIRLPTPELLIKDDKGEMYFLEDTFYGVPQIYWSFEVRTPAINNQSPQSAVCGEIYRKALIDSLSQVSYNAELAGLKLKIEEGEEGFIVILSGYDEKATLLLEDILQALTLPQLTEERFDLIVEELKRDYKNFFLDSPLQQAGELLEEMVFQPYVTIGQKASSIRSVTYDKFQAFVKRLFAKNFLEALVIGNLDEGEANHLWKLWQEALAGSSYPRKAQKPQQVTIWPNQGPYLLHRNTKAQGAALILSIEDPQFTFQKRGAQQILQQTLHKDFFQELRTRQQTGYIVNVSADEQKKALFDSFYVQSATHTPEELLWRTEAFIEMFLQELPTNIPQERFAVAKAALIAQLKERPKSLSDMGQLLQKLAFDYDGDFDWIEKRISTLNDLEYEEFLSLSEQFLSRTNKRRIAFIVQGPLKTPYRLTPVKSGKELKKNAKFL